MLLCPEIRCNIVSGSMWAPYYTMQNKFSNCFVWPTSGLKLFFSSLTDTSANNDLHVKIYGMVKRSGCAHVTLDFETNIQSRYF